MLSASRKIMVDKDGTLILPNMTLFPDREMLFSASGNVKIEEHYGGTVDTDYTGSDVREVSFDVYNTFDKGTAYAAFSEWIFNNRPYDNGLPVEAINLTGENNGAGKFTGTVTYSAKMLKNNLNIPIQSFSTKGGTAKLTQSFFTTAKVARDGMQAPDFQGGIGAKDGILEGCDIIVPTYSTTFERNNLPYSYVNQNYKRLLRSMTGSVNSSMFDGMEPGECIFVGCDGKMNITEEDGQTKITWNLTYEFRGSPSMGGIVIGDLPPIDKAGFDYLWVLRQNEDDEETKTTVPRPVAAYVEQVYLYSNFKSLGIL